MLRVVALASVVLLACTEHEPPSGPFVTSRVESKAFPFGFAPSLDVLFVVDRSPAMAPFRAGLLAQATQIADVLEHYPWGTPSLHIGVTTSDLGAEGVAVPGCTGDGDGGWLRGARFLSDLAAPDGSRVRNYEGSLGEALGALLDVGDAGCPYSRPLAAARRALENTVENAGFRRSDAYLAIVFVTAQDDCSFTDASFLAGSTSTDTSRCTTQASALPAVEDFVDFVWTVAAADWAVLVGAVIAPTDPACDAQPAPRLRALLQQLGSRGVETSLCGASYGDVLDVPLFFRTLGGPPCIETALFDEDPSVPGLQPACAAAYELSDGTEGVLPACGGDERLCWHLDDDLVNCPQTGKRITVDTHGVAYPLGWVTMQCLVEGD
ncbi:MAG TPA: hypothetical protein VM513_11105 [Kofleriaceae bacterium]|nr:hypothetical protein [Kofleriaceae bacterium]